MDDDVGGIRVLEGDSVGPWRVGEPVTGPWVAAWRYVGPAGRRTPAYCWRARWGGVTVVDGRVHRTPEDARRACDAWLVSVGAPVD